MNYLKRIRCTRNFFVRNCGASSSLLSFASVNPSKMSAISPHLVQNLNNGEWRRSESIDIFPDPLTGDDFLHVSSTSSEESKLFAANLKKCSKSGLHNPLKNVDRYLLYGDICARMSAKMRNPAVLDFFTTLIQRVAPKSRLQATGEVIVTRRFIENFSGDQVRFLARSFAVPGDHDGQSSNGFRWPYGPVVIITPFNFPLGK